MPADRRLRWLELALVVGITVSPSLATSIYIGINHFVDPNVQSAVAFRLLQGVAFEIAELSVLVYVLFRQGRSLLAIGLKFELKDVVRSIPLLIAASFAFFCFYYICEYGNYFAVGHYFNASAANVGFMHQSPGSLAQFILLLYSLINPFREELIVRGYLMSEIKALKRSWLLAGFTSVLVQCSCHIYQGIWPAILLGAPFAIFSIYYAKTRRIYPVVLAHLYMDLYAVAPFIHHR